MIINRLSKNKIFYILIFLLFFTNIITFSETNDENENEYITDVINEIFINRNKAILENTPELLDNLYDKSTRNGTWAYEHEIIKMKYIHNWSGKQGITFTDIEPDIIIKRISKDNDIYSINVTCSTTYKYIYDDKPEEINLFKIGSYHSLKLKQCDDNLVIAREWYTDPFADSLTLDEIKQEDIKNFINSQTARDLSTINDRRKNALDYADKYCGAAGSKENDYSYNKEYRNYNFKGGDCANFASQILHEGGKFKKNASWNYDKGGATHAWLNANGFKSYLIYSGRGSLIAHGDYKTIYKAAYKLLPGDIVAYEKKGKVTHVSVVTGADSKGYTLVNCHNTDRYRVPWDLGWSDKKIKFWLIHVNY